MKPLFIFMVLSAGMAHASDFSERVKAGKLALASPLAQKYQSSWGPTVSAAMTSCRALGFRVADSVGVFTFVGNVSPDGTVFSTQVQPSTRLSRCFAEHFDNTRLPPPPPELLNGRSLLPIADELELRQ